MLTLDHVSFSYPDGTAVLKDISFTIRDGEQVALIGANGTGKSTLMKVILGLLSAKGSIAVDDLPMTAENLPKIRSLLGYVLQDADNQMFMPTVLEDMIFGPMNYGLDRESAIKKARETLETLGVPHLETRQNHKLSGGEKRMAAIATILAMDPKIMLMDEPSSNLDPKNRRTLIHTLNSLSLTKIIATHDLDMVLDTCKRVILINSGTVVADGPVSEILYNKELLEANDLELPFRLSDR